MTASDRMPDRTATIECLTDPDRARGALVAAGFRIPTGGLR